MLAKVILSAVVIFLATADFYFINAQQRIGLSSISKRLDKLEREVKIVNRQAARLKTGDSNSEILVDEEYENLKYANASASARIDELNETIRRLRGKIEEIEFIANKNFQTLTAEMKNLNTRLAGYELALNPAGKQGDTTKPEEENLNVVDEEFKDETADANTNPDSNTGEIEDPQISAVKLYNRALKSLKESNYQDAQKDLNYFIKAHEKNKLIGNAYYWLGETFFVEGDYVTAADKFRQGYEIDQNGLKSAANLFKLGVSLARQQKDAQACVVLSQVEKKYPDQDKKFQRKLSGEIGRIGCEKAG